MASTLTAFLDRYRRALAADDIDALAELVHLPCLIMGPQVHAVLTADELKQALREQLQRQREVGMADASFEVLAHRRLEARYLTVEVTWQLRNTDGVSVWEFSVMYLLTAPERGWKIVTVAPLEPGLSASNPTGSHEVVAARGRGT